MAFEPNRIPLVRRLCSPTKRAQLRHGRVLPSSGEHEEEPCDGIFFLWSGIARLVPAFAGGGRCDPLLLVEEHTGTNYHSSSTWFCGGTEWIRHHEMKSWHADLSRKAY